MHASTILQRLFGGRGDGVDRECREAIALCRSLLGERGEASGAALARQALAAFSALRPASRDQFFDILATEFSPSPDRVAEELEREFPRLRAFATLSPIPGFCAWLDSTRVRLSAGAAGENRLALLTRLDAPDWHQAGDEPLRRLLTAACAHYLLHAKQGNDPLDPVARFHLGNGASLERLNWLGDTSAQGFKHSAGMMVNYLYRLGDIERNHERFVNEHVVVAARGIQKFARECPVAGDGHEPPGH
ncbi:MAG: malonyl-CoA decarboxylase family protein [Proteobacteria bacterium]|nr:malonyl-CoA decarboxylase family protein [Pseudomonadota bacterium]